MVLIYCSLCSGLYRLDADHVRSTIHQSQIRKLPIDWYELDPKKIKQILAKKRCDSKED